MKSNLTEGKEIGLCRAVIDHDDVNRESKDGFWNLSRKHTMHGNATYLIPFRLMPLEGESQPARPFTHLDDIGYYGTVAVLNC